MKKEVNEIKNSKELIIPADKTANMYKIKPETYEKMLHNNITKDYRKSNNNIVKEINKEAKSISEKFKISDRVNVMPEKNAFITIKDHKENFDNDPKCRLINPTKSEIGKISKVIIQNINSKIREKSNLLQWRSTQEAIEWFENIETKNKKELIQCDIESFYPSISENLLKKSLAFAEKFVTITNKERNTIMHARKTILKNNDETWIKKEGLFDVGMGANDSAEVAELVGLMLLWNIRELIPEIQFGLYRDDGLGVMKTGKGCHTENIKKKLIKIFKDNELKIDIKMRLQKADFLDVTFDLYDGTYKPYKKTK